MDEVSPAAATEARGHAGAAWLVILLCTLLSAWAAFAAKQSERDGGGLDVTGIQNAEMEGRLLVGQRQLDLPVGDSEMRRNLDSLDGGRLTRRHRVVVLSAELEGPEAARARLTATEAYARQAQSDEKETLDADARTDGLLRAIYGDEGDRADVAKRADALSEDARAHLRENLGWIGRLAVLPEGTRHDSERSELLAEARTGAALTLGAGGGFCCLAGVGLLTAVGLLIGLATGKLTWGFDLPAYPGGVLAEIFAVWFLLMALPTVVGTFAPEAERALSIGAFLLGFAALAHGRLYGLRFRDLRRAIGLHVGAGFWKEAGLGVVGCVAAVPVVIVGLLGTVALGKLAAALDLSADASHPIIGGLSGAGPGLFVLILLAAAVVAPLVEETFFRGVLYGHLRQTTAGLPRAISVAVSAFVTSLVFAAVHPQSWIAIPALGALAFAFALLREWRGSLVAPIVAHAVWNGTLVCAAWAIFG